MSREQDVESAKGQGKGEGNVPSSRLLVLGRSTPFRDFRGTANDTFIAPGVWRRNNIMQTATHGPGRVCSQRNPVTGRACSQSPMGPGCHPGDGGKALKKGKGKGGYKSKDRGDHSKGYKGGKGGHFQNGKNSHTKQEEAVVEPDISFDDISFDDDSTSESSGDWAFTDKQLARIHADDYECDGDSC